MSTMLFIGKPAVLHRQGSLTVGKPLQCLSLCLRLGLKLPQYLNQFHHRRLLFQDTTPLNKQRMQLKQAKLMRLEWMIIFLA